LGYREILLFQFSQYLPCVLFSCKAIHDFQLCELDINGVVIFAKENLDIIFEYCRSPLDNEQYIP